MENTQGFIAINAYALLLIIFITVVFSLKKRLHHVEDNTYAYLLITTIVVTLSGIILGIMVSKELHISSFLVGLTNKIYLVFLALWAQLLTFYTYYVAIIKKGDITRPKKIFSICAIIITAIIILLPIQIDNSGTIAMSSGLSLMFTYGIVGIDFLTMFILLLMDYKNFKSKKYIPIYSLAVLGTLLLVVQILTNLNYLVNPALVLIVFIMYFTIENPDVKMLNELYKNRELMEQGYEDKYNFLFEMTQEAKKPILDLNRVTSELRLEDDPNKIKDGMAIINNLTRQLDFSINNVLNISSFDIQKLKIVNTKYDVLKVCDGLSTTLRNEIKKDVTFNMDLPKSVPTLYGDYMKLRQILYSLLNNASKNTENGSVNLKLNIIEKYDFCRLIFNISDTGKGMSIEKINDILSSTGELNKEEMEYLEKKEFNFKVCQKVVKIMGGNLMIKSTIGKGTDITLTLDQRVYHEKENSILNQYESAINTSKKVLIVAQNKDLAGYLKKKLNNNDISYSALAYGGDAVDRIKAGKSYDYILVEDDMKEMSGLATLQELQKLKNFDIPVIIMLNESKDSIKDHYIKDGFDDYLLTNNLEEEINRIIDKY